MNKHLQEILNHIQQDEILSPEQKNAVLKSLKDADKELEITTLKLDRTEKVKRTTAILLEETITELEQKRKAVEVQNRELEIEAGLERVRTVALSMNSREDMLFVCRIISEQLGLLNVKELRNVQTAIFYEERGTYMNYEYYTKHHKSFITETSYTNHEIAKTFVAKMLKGRGEVSITRIEGEEKVKEWLTYQKATNVFIDTFLETASSLNYYWFSLGLVALGISTYAALSDDELSLFKRFLNVFELAYRRYLDIEKATAQAKEAQVEAALEKVRARTMGMQRSDELAETAVLLFHQLMTLGLDLRGCGFNIWEKEEKTCTAWMSGPQGKLSPPFNLPLTDDPFFIRYYESRRNGEDFWVYETGKEELAARYEYLRTLPVLGKLIENDSKDGIEPELPELLIDHVVNFSNGNLIFITYKPCPEAWDIFRRFGKVFDQTYTRFLDLKNAEAQVREAKIEASLERTRTQSMIMQHSRELDNTLRVFHEQVLLLGINSAFSFLWLPDEEEKRHIFWAAWAENNSKVFKSKAIDYPLDRNEPATAQCLADWKSHESVYSYHVPPSAVENYFALWQELIDGVEQLKPEYFSGGLYYVEAFMKYGCFGVMATADLTEDEKKILGRFAIEFERTYTRFLDLQKAEAQARESKIEAALERVRSRSMAMQKSEELKEVIQVVYEQLVHLNIQVEHTGFIMDYKERDDMDIWLADRHMAPFRVTIPYFDSPHWNSFIEAKEKGLDFFANRLGFEEKNRFYQDLFKLFPVPDEAKGYYFNCPGLAISTVLLDNIALYIENFAGILYNDEENNTLMRFGKVFQQTYTRFLDLKKAEAQARESEIELALERVRARTMAMQHSDELADTSLVLFQQVKDLGFETWSCGFCTWQKDDLVEAWMGADSGGLLPPMMIPYKKEPTHKNIYEASLIGEPAHDKIWEGPALEEHYAFLKTIPSVKDAIDILVTSGLSLPERQCYYAGFFEQGYLLLITKDPNDELKDLSKRFAKVFNQTYTRFLDLQKAEARTREAKIEAALEKVRARTMAMRHSDELLDAATLLFQQIESLGASTWNCSFNIWTEDKKYAVAWNGTKDGFGRPFNTPASEDVFLDFYEAAQRGDELYEKEIGGKELELHYDYLSTLPGVGVTLAELKAAGIALPTFQVFNIAYFAQGYLMFITYNPVPQFAEIFKRFAKVFEQTYTRFLDLQKAEAQAKEAKIEAALERVRSKTMAMHNSADVGETTAVMVDELKKLEIETIRCGIGIMHEPGDMEVWTISTNKNNKTDIIIGWLDMNMHPLLHGAFESWRKKNESYSYELKDDDLLNYYDAINNYPGYPIRYDTSTLPALIYHNEFYFAEGTLFAFSSEQLSQEQRKIFIRFAGVFGQTYRRYLDLQKAEAQAKESQVEAALERVRSRTLAMQRSDELAETAAVLFQQLITLGIEPNRLYIAIVKDDNGNTEFWITDEDGSKVSSAFESNLNDNLTFKKMFEGWKAEKKSLVIDMQGEELQEYFTYLTSIHVPFKGGLTQKRRVQDIAYFSKGFIGMASPDEQPVATLQLLERFAYVFNLTFTRFNDLKLAEAHAIQAKEDLIKLQTEKKRAEDALTELRSTQTQLIQSEKMASLGELTAGIAHEIQNPLNFVNNFSEVNKELIAEMKAEIEKGNLEEVKFIAEDIEMNSEKINHHGKRADSIVKGMLQHSRSSNSAKEPTDINALADEYLRLSYHGLRAKDNSFNATIKTDFDKSVGNINIIPQDIGRVLLNLYNNAFYAVNLKRKDHPAGYEPIIEVSTSRSPSTGEGRGEVRIKVKDNGNGIPQKVINKIFQPFFTTKPTGQGTGLGLSLSYDIIKAHGGEIKVETKESEGSIFIIQLVA